MRIYTALIVVTLALILAAPALAQSPTETPFPAPTMRYYSRATLMAGIGVKPYRVLQVTPFDVLPKVVGELPDSASWFSTFLFLMAENGSLAWISAFSVILFVAFVLIAILSHIRKSPPLTSLRENIETQEAHVKEKFYAGAGTWASDMREARSMLGSKPWDKFRGRR